MLADLLVWLLVPPDAAIVDRLALVAVLPCWILLNKSLRLYDRDANLIHKSTLNELPTLFQSLTVGTALIYLFSPFVLGFEVGRAQTLVFFAGALTLTPLLRAAARGAVRRRFERERCVIVGSGSVAGLVARKLDQHPEYGVDVLGYVDEPGGANGSELERLGTIDRFEDICRSADVDRVIVAFSSLSHEHLLDVIRVSRRVNLQITIVPRLFEVIGHAVDIDSVEGLTLMGLRSAARTRSSLALKRAIDLAGALAGLVVLAPMLAVIALAIRLSSPGPVFYRQQRIGLRGKPFTMLKFRTMLDGADALKPSLLHLNEADGPMFKIADDPRITRVGRFLRRTSLDELPQLINVLRGEMSLVGPRPLVPNEANHVIGWHRARIELMPGLTGPWQVLGRTAIPFEEMVKLDYLYAAEWSLWNDIRLLIRTAPVMLQQRGR